MNFDVTRLPEESDFEYKLRLCLAKKAHILDMDWIEIRDLLKLDISPETLRKQAVGYYEYHEYLHGDNGVANRILSLSDLHYPFAKPLDEFAGYIDKVDTLQLNGDIIDCQSISKFPKSYRISPMEEIIGARQYLIDLIEMLRPSCVVANYGNHELRFGAYLAKRLDNEIQELLPNTPLDLIFTDGFYHYDKRSGTKSYYEPLCKVFDNIDIIYSGKWYSQIGDTVFCHPRAFSSMPLKTAEKALMWFRNEGFDFKNLVMAHTHRLGSYKIGVSDIYEQGACCETKMMLYGDGMLTNSQKEGFMYMNQGESGNTIAKNTKIVSLN